MYLYTIRCAGLVFALGACLLLSHQAAADPITFDLSLQHAFQFGAGTTPEVTLTPSSKVTLSS
jgi:hypothetical protein